MSYWSSPRISPRLHGPHFRPPPNRLSMPDTSTTTKPMAAKHCPAQSPSLKRRRKCAAVHRDDSAAQTPLIVADRMRFLAGLDSAAWQLK